MIKLIVALDKKRGIALADGPMPYVQADLKHFRDLTQGGTILMGHNTYKTIGRPLPNRANVVASRDRHLKIDGAKVTADAQSFIKQAKDLWVIGGEQIFQTAMPYADELYLTQIAADFGCSKFFPPYENEFKMTKQSDWQTEGDLRFRYEIWRREA